MKKLIACIVALCMCVTLMPKSALAEETTLKSQIPNAVVMMDLDNIDCEKIDTLKDMSLVIKNDYNGEVVEVATIEEVEVIEDEYAVMVLGQSLDEINDEVLGKLEVIQEELNDILTEENVGDVYDSLLEDMELELDEDAITEKLEELLGSYKIEIQGEDVHYTVEDASGMLITSELIQEVMDMIKTLISELFEIDMSGVTSIADAIDVLLPALEMTEAELIEEINSLFEGELTLTQEDLDKYVAEIDELLSYLLSEEYNGTVYATGILKCQCPKFEEYYVDHYYYKEVKGQMQWVGYQTDTYKGESGEIVKAADLEQKPVYEGKTYTFVKSTDYFDDTVPMTECKVGEDLGFIFVYELKAPVDDTNLENDKENLEDTDLENDKETDIEDEKEIDETPQSPDTGDEMNLAAYIIAMIVAMGAMAVARRRN